MRMVLRKSGSLGRALPKSSRIGVSPPLRMMLAGFISRWMIFFSCSIRRFSMNGFIIRISSSGGIAPCSRTRCASVSPSTYAITRYAVLFSSNKSSTCTTDGQREASSSMLYSVTNLSRQLVNSLASLRCGTTLPSSLRAAMLCGKYSFTATISPRTGSTLSSFKAR